MLHSNRRTPRRPQVFAKAHEELSALEISEVEPAVLPTIGVAAPADVGGDKEVMAERGRQLLNQAQGPPPEPPAPRQQKKKKKKKKKAPKAPPAPPPPAPPARSNAYTALCVHEDPAPLPTPARPSPSLTFACCLFARSNSALCLLDDQESSLTCRVGAV